VHGPEPKGAARPRELAFESPVTRAQVINHRPSAIRAEAVSDAPDEIIEVVIGSRWSHCWPVAWCSLLADDGTLRVCGLRSAVEPAASLCSKQGSSSSTHYLT
jgi:hypothetical protein